MTIRTPINWNKYSYSEQELREAVRDNISYASTAKNLGLTSQKTIMRAIDILKINTDHWSGQGHLKGKSHSYVAKKELSEILVENSTYDRTKMKKRLINEGLLINQCSCCRLQDWLGQPISLHIDHINGVYNDNRLENLRLLCPNCHSQTSTYTGKNKRGKKVITNYQKKHGSSTTEEQYPKTQKNCAGCEVEINTFQSNHCRSCAAKISHPNNRPSSTQSV